MKRHEFLRVSSLATVGLGSGLMNSALFGAPVNEKISLIKSATPRQKVILPTGEFRYGWLAKLVTSTLVGALVSSIVENYTDDCICYGNTCYKSPGNYTDAIGIYQFKSYERRFVRQMVVDQSVSFQNVSVPFLTSSNQLIGNVEGPSLAGLCWAANSLFKDHDYRAIRKVLIPKDGIQNGGYRFNENPCYPTKYETDYGSAQIAYRTNGRGNGSIKVEARDKYDNIDWEEVYDIEYT
ncbi:MAG: hypothetical protein AAF587_37440 [Bacteroidota bacterium]